MPRDASLPCGHGVALRWLDAPLGIGVRVSYFLSAPLGDGALLLWDEYPPTGGAPTFVLDFLPTLDASTIISRSFAPLTEPVWLIPQGFGALVIEPRDAPGTLSLQWALFDEIGVGPLRDVAWPIPPGVSAGPAVVCKGAAALPIVLIREAGGDIGAALVQWDDATSATLSDLAFPADYSLGAWAPPAEWPTIEACVASDSVVYALARNAYSGPLRLLRWSGGHLLELPHALGASRSASGTALVDAQGPLFFSFDASEPWIVRAFRPTTGGDTIELDAHPLDGFPDPPMAIDAFTLPDGTAMLFYNHSGILNAIGFADGRFGPPTLITDFTCASQSPSYAHGGHVLWPGVCYTGTNRMQLGMFELCGGPP